MDQFSLFDITGRTALVTGGGTGIGYHITLALARAGAQVMIASRREDVLNEACDRLNGMGLAGKVIGHPVDLLSRSSIEKLAEEADARFGGVDIFVGNAAQDYATPLGEVTNDSIDQILQMNVSANVELFRHFLPHMRRNQWGRVILLSSGVTVCGSPNDGMSMYAASKGALNAFTKTAAAETGLDGITVNSLLLGTFATDMLEGVIEQKEQAFGEVGRNEFLDTFNSMIAIGRLGRPEEIEGLIHLLASDAGSYITGGNIVIDGGLTSMVRPRPTVYAS